MRVNLELNIEGGAMGEEISASDGKTAFVSYILSLIVDSNIKSCKDCTGKSYSADKIYFQNLKKTISLLFTSPKFALRIVSRIRWQCARYMIKNVLTWKHNEQKKTYEYLYKYIENGFRIFEMFYIFIGALTFL